MADYAVPRDTDPVSRSSLRFLLREKEDSLIIIPLVNDSSRKRTYILENEGKRVLTLSVPPVKSDAGFREYEHQINRCIRGLCRHTKRVVTRKALGAACRDVSYAYGQLAEFEELADDREDVVSGLCRMLVIASPIYYHGISDQLKCVIDRFYSAAYPRKLFSCKIEGAKGFWKVPEIKSGEAKGGL